MNNKRGGAGAKIILVLILMLASAVGGAYGYRVLDGKLAVREAKKQIESIRVSDYDSPESTAVQGLIDNANKDLDTADTRKQVYAIMDTFGDEIEKIQTRTQKELEAAKKEAEEARNNNNNGNSNGNNYNNNNGNYDSNYGYNDNNNGSDYNSNNNGNYDSNNNDNYDSNSNDSGSSSESGGGAITNDDGSSGRGGLLGNLLGGGSDGDV